MLAAPQVSQVPSLVFEQISPKLACFKKYRAELQVWVTVNASLPRLLASYAGYTGIQHIHSPRGGVVRAVSLVRPQGLYSI